jgi:DNA (cytosine-5)-methyltransferase 1
MGRKVLDLFSAAAGGWSLGMHRAGFETVAACEVVAWRRALYSENNPGVRLYDDVCTLTGERLLADLGTLPDIIVGSPPCQDISSANTSGKGVDGARSGLYFEAIRLVGECRPRWVALENSSNLRTKGADRVLPALAALGYSCEACVVGADDVGADHERKRSWVIAFDPRQVADPTRIRREGWRARRRGEDGDDAIGDGDGDGDAAASPQSVWNGGLAHHLRLDDGLSAWVANARIAVGGARGTGGDSLLVEAYGDAVLPQITEAIGRAILRTEAALASVLGQ